MIAQMFEIKYTLGPEVFKSVWHAEVVRSQLNRNLDSIFPEVYDEIKSAFDELLATGEDGAPGGRAPPT